MKLSIEKNFLFVEVPKTASTSLSVLLKPYALPNNRSPLRRFTSKFPFREAPEKVHLRKHDPIYWARKKLGSDVFTRLFKFGFVRNPYDHLVSGYGFMQQYGHPHSHKIVDKSFSEYIDFRLSQTFGHDQSYFLTDRKGRLLVDRVCRFENLEKDVEYLLDRLGLVGQIPHRLRTQRRHYSEYFSAADIVKANPIVARDLDNFGYTFEG